jgi:hypothetical protein
MRACLLLPCVPVFGVAREAVDEELARAGGGDGGGDGAAQQVDGDGGGHDLAVSNHVSHHLPVSAAALHVRAQQVARGQVHEAVVAHLRRSGAKDGDVSMKAKVGCVCVCVHVCVRRECGRACGEGGRRRRWGCGDAAAARRERAAGARVRRAGARGRVGGRSVFAKRRAGARALRTMLAHCVPLPAPGPPSTNTTTGWSAGAPPAGAPWHARQEEATLA